MLPHFRFSVHFVLYSDIVICNSLFISGIPISLFEIFKQSSKLQFYLKFSLFLRATAVPAGTAEARISYGDSVCLSVTRS